MSVNIRKTGGRWRAGTENVPNSRAPALLLIVRLSDGAIGLGASLGTSGISMSVRRRVIIEGSSLLSWGRMAMRKST